MTTVAILQPGYLPWLGFFEQMQRADVFVYLDDVQYTKNDWRNRNRVKTATGPSWLTVPVRTRGRGVENLRETQIILDRWPRQHRRTVESSYAKAPFAATADGLYEIWDNPPGSLLQLDLLVIEWCREVLALHTPTVTASSLDANNRDPTERLVTLCQRLGADRFYEGVAGRGYLKLALFDAAGIEVQFQDYTHPYYPQQHPRAGFISHLSVLDLILNCGPEALRILTGEVAFGSPSDTAIHHADDFRDRGGTPD